MHLSKQLSDALDLCIEHDFSDLHLSSESRPMGRLHGSLVGVGTNTWTAQDMQQLIDEALDTHELELLRKHHSLDSSLNHGGHRFRLNLFSEHYGYALAIRKLESVTRSIQELGLPDEITDLAQLPSGLVLFTGPTGSGKSTSLAALIDIINQERPCHIITVEDPIEYLHANKKALVHQRELGVNVTSFSNSLREALREDPDVILVGEMRDLDTMRAAITAAETGHLVLSTLHCADTVGALDRILGMYPADEQDSLRRQLSMVLRAIVSQTLVPTRKDDARAVIVEMLTNTPAISNLIRMGQFRQIYSLLEIGAERGIISMDNHLASLVHQGRISMPTANRLIRNSQLFRDRIQFLNNNTSG